MNITEKPSVMNTRELNLCTSCEICSAVCPTNAILMEYKHGQFLPIIDKEKCTNCGLCFELCPGIDLQHIKLKNNHFSVGELFGSYLDIYTAYSKNPKIRENATSGGLITNLIVELIQNKEYDVAFVLDFDTFDGKSARLKATNNVKEIIRCSKSKYIPASAYNVILALAKRDNRRYIIVGTPCQISGIKKFIKKFNISEENILFLGLFCDKTLNFNILRYFEDKYGNSIEKLTKFDFRNKEKCGWPGDSKLYFDSGKNLVVSRKVRMKLKKYFQLNRCLFCLDKLNILSDISFGDCYIKDKSNLNGESSVIIRTKKGKDIFDKYSYLFTLEEENIEDIGVSQHLMDKKENMEYVRYFTKTSNRHPNDILDYKIDNQISEQLSKLQKHIMWGESYNKNKIESSLMVSKMVSKLKTIGEAILAGISVGECLLINSFCRNKTIRRTKVTRNIIIIGGELFNKGAQAMTFTVVDQMKKRFPNKKIYLFSTVDFKRKDEEKNKYKFNILPWDLKTKIRLSGFCGKLLRKNSNYIHLENNIENVIKNADFFIDISGYALSSQRGAFCSLNYLLNIILAKKYSRPYYIFPQSIGPFNYPIKYKMILNPLLKLYLTYPLKIFAREEEGFICVRKFSKKNIEKSYDIVLQNKGYDLDNIYNKNTDFKYIKIESNSVCIIPNFMVIEQANINNIYSIYKSLISKLINAKKTVYLVRHSHEDLEICERIKNIFPDNKRVRLISNDLSAIELENMIKQFDFVIASRYHSIIHSYKNGVPCLVIGWATKYHELLKCFNQLDYIFDCRADVDINEITGKLDKIMRDHNYEKESIINKINILNKENIFDNFGEDKCLSYNKSKKCDFTLQ